MSRWTKYFDEIYAEMWSRFLGFDPEGENAQEEWDKLRWTVAEEQRFRGWVVSYLRKKGITKRVAEKEAGWFLLQYGPRWSDPENWGKVGEDGA